MKYLVLLFIIACSPSYKKLPDYAMPPELEGCKVFTISDGGMASPNLYVVKCPNQQPTTSFMRSCGNGCTKREYVQVTQ
jgi:hypothetical protein